MVDDTPDAPGPADPADAATPDRVDRLAAEYREAGRPFARVTVVRREPPVSATVGDRALVTPDGDLVGWVGGAACAQSVAAKEATAAIETGEPRLVGLAPDPDDVDRPGLEAYPMTCHSGGTLELFVDPVTPTPRLVVVGDSPVARALARLAAEGGYDVTVAADVDDAVDVEDDDALAAAVDGAAAVVVASMGEYDETGVAAALAADVPYVGLVASDARHEEVAAAVADRLGVDADRVADATTAPAGLDLGAETPAEIAVSVLAELVAVRRERADAIPVEVSDPTGLDAAGEGDVADDAEETDDETAVDPVCGMDVAVDDAAATVTHDGETYHFCGEGCAEAFERDPDSYRGGVAGD